VNELNVTICDGKYTIIQASNGGIRVLRYGEEWRDVTGDNVIAGLAWELQEARKHIQRLKDARTKAAANSLANMISYEGAINKIKRLEEAGDLMVQHFYTDEPRSEMWEKAKEAKP